MYKSFNFYKFIQEISFKLDHTFYYDKKYGKIISNIRISNF